ncbi:MAG TPA: hypothetical protein VKZ59_05930 [Acidobacteriota bacterium]|nr:hypothetical protein [Acidobacteriota bacterium]
MLRLAALFFFTMASFGFLLFMLKYPRGSDVQLWGIRLSYLLGFIGVFMLTLWRGSFTEFSAIIISSLVVSLIVFEVSTRFLK